MGNYFNGETTDVGLSLDFIVECQSSVVREEKSISFNDFGKDKQTDELKREGKEILSKSNNPLIGERRSDYHRH